MSWEQLGESGGLELDPKRTRLLSRLREDFGRRPEGKQCLLRPTDRLPTGRHKGMMTLKQVGLYLLLTYLQLGL